MFIDGGNRGVGDASLGSSNLLYLVLKLISLVQKKILKNKTLPQIAEESEEDTIVIEPIYTLIKENPEAEKEEIYKMLNL